MLDPKLFKNSSKDEIKEVRKKEVDKKLNKIGTVTPHRNHILFSINNKTYEIKRAVFAQQDAQFTTGPQNKKVIVEKDCVYLSALNKKNLIKKLRKLTPDSIEEIINANK
jgi:hypothetical protein